MIKLRDYQIESVESIWSDLQDHKAVLLVMATGGGKTVVFLELVDRMLKLKPDARILMIAHRKELIEQPLERLESFYPHLASKTGVVMASQNDVSAQVVSATIQTLTSGKRLQEYLAHGAPDLLITDEC